MFVLILNHSKKGISVLSIHQSHNTALELLEKEKEFIINSLDSELHTYTLKTINKDKIRVNIECSELVSGWLYKSYVKTNFFIEIQCCIPKGNFLRQETKKEFSMMEDLKIALAKRRKFIGTED